MNQHNHNHNQPPPEPGTTDVVPEITYLGALLRLISMPMMAFALAMHVLFGWFTDPLRMQINICHAVEHEDTFMVGFYLLGFVLFVSGLAKLSIHFLL